MKSCISCNKTKNIRYHGPRCVNCYRKEVNPQTLENIKAYRKRVGTTLSDRFNKGKAEAKIRKIKWSLTKEEYSEFNSKPCLYCGGSLPRYGVGLDRISLDKKLGYCKENVIPCCTSCNSIRGDKLSVAETLIAIDSIKEHRISIFENFNENNYNIDTRTICIFGEITGTLSLQVQKAFDVLESVNKYSEITVRIMSDGGNWFDSLAIYDRIKSSPCPIKMIGTGLVGSAATVIFQAGDIREITENCVFLIHDGTEGFEGEAKSFEAWGDASKKSREILYSIYSQTSKKPIDFWKNICAKDCILWQNDILKLGLADKIL